MIEGRFQFHSFFFFFFCVTDGQNCLGWVVGVTDATGEETLLLRLLCGRALRTSLRIISSQERELGRRDDRFEKGLFYCQ